MEIIRCEKGHFYDAEVNKTCPQCAAEAQSGGAVSAYGSTEPIGAGPGVTMPVNSADMVPDSPSGGPGETMPVTDPGFTPTDFVAGAPGGGRQVQNYEPTTPVFQGGISGFNPVTGWLVCVDGADKGMDYRIRNGNNYIGRSQSMDICIQNDQHISNQNAAIIGYDDMEHTFFFGPAGGHNTVRVNGKMVINAVELKPFDELTIGMTKLMFVPLCGERFNWNAK